MQQLTHLYKKFQVAPLSFSDALKQLRTKSNTVTTSEPEDPIYYAETPDLDCPYRKQLNELRGGLPWKYWVLKPPSSITGFTHRGIAGCDNFGQFAKLPQSRLVKVTPEELIAIHKNGGQRPDPVQIPWKDDPLDDGSRVISYPLFETNVTPHHTPTFPKTITIFFHMLLMTTITGAGGFGLFHFLQQIFQ